MEKQIDNSKLYELVLNYKSAMEIRREETNKYFTSLFAAIISITPLIDKFKIISNDAIKGDNIKYALILLSCIGLMLSLSWVLTLKRIDSYLKGTDKLLMELEKKFAVSFITYMTNYLYKIKAPDRVSKQEMFIPYTFMVIFSIILSYSILWGFL